MIDKYFIRNGLYKIPFDEMSSDISEVVIEALQDSWVLFRDSLGYYILVDVNKKYISYRVEEYEEVVLKCCKKYQIPIYSVSVITMAKYFSDTMIQKLVDLILTFGYSIEKRKEGKCLGFTMKDNKTFYLVEVDEEGIL